MQLIGLDIGTTSIAGLTLDVDTGTVDRCISVPNPATLVSADAFARCQDPEMIFRTVEDILHQLLSASPDIRAIGISSQMHGILYVDRDGSAVSPLYTWQDGRGNEPFEGVTYAQQFTEQTGYESATGYGMVTHYYHVMNRHVSMHVAKICTIGDYVALQLSKTSQPLLNATQAASLGAYNIVDHHFDLAALERVQITPDLLPHVASGPAVVGYFCKRVPVCTAIGDNQASYLGTVRSPQPTLLMNVGTGAQLSMAIDEPMSTMPLGWELRPLPSNDGKLLVGSTLAGGKAYALVETFFRQILEMFGQAPEVSLFEKMEALLSQSSPIHHPIDVSPRFYGTRQNPQVTGHMAGLSVDNFTPLHVMDGVLRGIAAELRSLYLNLPQHLQDRVQEIVAAGNTIRRSSYFVSIVEALFQSPLMVPTYGEEAALGAAFYAGSTIGVYPSWREASANLTYLRKSERDSIGS